MISLGCLPATRSLSLAELFPQASLAIDFTKGLAHVSGVQTPLRSILSCSRSAAGFAPNAADTLQSFPANSLRCTARGLLVEEARSNLFLGSATPATQTIALTAGTYTLSMRGSGTTSLSGASSGSASATSPLSFNLASSGDVTITPGTSASHVQLEAGPTASSPIVTTGVAATRDLDKIGFSVTSWFNPQACTIMVEWEQLTTSTAVQTLIRWQNASYSRLRTGGAAVTQVHDASSTLILNVSAPGGAPQPGIHTLTAALAPNNMSVAWSASLGSGTAGVSNDNAGTPAPGASSIYLGSNNSGEALNGWLRKLVYWPTRRTL
jgi:hypothetical protein